MAKKPTHVKCWIHQKIIPFAVADLHHIAPQAYGGSDSKENLTYLCSSDHQLAHRLAVMVEAGKNGEAEDICQQVYLVPEQRMRFKQVVKDIVATTVLAKEAGIGREEPVISLALPAELHTKLRLLASERRMNGRPVALSKYIEAILTQHVKTKLG